MAKKPNLEKAVKEAKLPKGYFFSWFFGALSIKKGFLGIKTVASFSNGKNIVTVSNERDLPVVKGILRDLEAQLPGTKFRIHANSK